MGGAKSSSAGPFDTYAYWLMPHGLRGFLTTVFWPANAARAGGRRPRKKEEAVRADVGPAGARRRYPGPRGTFPILAPGKPGGAVSAASRRAGGEHAFWRGSLWGRTVALQGDSSFTKFDLFEVAGQQLLYWGTFRGNGYYDSEETHSFSSPFVWMDQWMSVGDARQQRVTDSVFDPRLRRATNSGEGTLRVEIAAHHDTWRDPDSQTTYEDVLEVHYWGRYPEAASREVYHLGRGLGTIRFETANAQEPSGVRYQYAEYFERFTPPPLPTLPWVDPFRNATHVRNGYFEDFLVPPAEGGAVGSYLRGWSGSADAAITTDGGDEGASPWKIVLRGATGGGDASADFVASDWIPVTPGQRYRLSGRVWRRSAADNVYLDFNDGIGQGGDFADAQGLATGTDAWETVAAETTVGPTTMAIRVRFVRDGANEGEAYGDAVTLQRL
jgi:hypothetical protein